MAASAWFPAAAPRAGSRVRLVCLGGAGTGASEFAAWPAGLPPWVEVWAAALPGRERRIREAPAQTMAQLADPLAAELRRLDDGTPWALFGHSFGGLVAHEVALRVVGEVAVCGLVVASSVAPHHQASRLPVTADDDETLLAWARGARGTDPALLADERFARWLAGDLRATLRIRRGCPAAPPRPLPCPVLAVGGAGDPDAGPHDLAAWRDCTTAGFACRQVGRGHFFLRDRRADLLAVVVAHLDRWTARPEHVEELS